MISTPSYSGGSCFKPWPDYFDGGLCGFSSLQASVRTGPWNRSQLFYSTCFPGHYLIIILLQLWQSKHYYINKFNLMKIKYALSEAFRISCHTVITHGKWCRVATESFIYVSCSSSVYVIISCEEKISYPRNPCWRSYW